MSLRKGSFCKMPINKTYLGGRRNVIRVDVVGCGEVKAAANNCQVFFRSRFWLMLFNCCNLAQPVFDDLELFIKFTQTNRKNLADREMYLSSLTRTAGIITEATEGSK